MTDDEQDAVLSATAQAVAALKLVEKLLAFIAGQSPQAMGAFLAEALKEQPIEGTDPHPSQATLVQETADRIEWEMLSGNERQLRKARRAPGH